MRNSTVADVMTTRVLVARPTMPIKEVARVLGEHRISALPVLDVDDHPVGIVSERDLLAKQAHPIPVRPRWWRSRSYRQDARRATGDTAGDVMTPDPVTIRPTAPLAEAARRMTEHRVKRLPVVDGNGELVGVVSRGDLVRRFLRPDDEIRAAVVEDVFVHGLWSDPAGIEVAVEDGIVTLTGTVDRRSFAQVAERLVRRMDGVVDVVNRLTHAVDDGGLRSR